MVRFRYIFYAITILMVVIPIIPLPLPLPFLDEFFGGKMGMLVVVFVVFAVILFEVSALICLIYQAFSFREINKLLLLETMVFAIIIFSAVWVNFNIIDSQINLIYWINKDKQPESFHNPFLGFQMRDCRDITDRFDVVFIPRSLSIETDYLAYAPKRKAVFTDSRFAKKLNDDWYIENSGSMWADDLRNCAFQSKIIF